MQGLGAAIQEALWGAACAAGGVGGRGGAILPTEWAALGEWQRELSWAVRRENFEPVTSLGEAPCPSL